jgi:hypothetical protein
MIGLILFYNFNLIFIIIYHNLYIRSFSDGEKYGNEMVIIDYTESTKGSNLGILKFAFVPVLA